MIYFYDTVIFSHPNKREENQDISGYMIGAAAPDSAGTNASVMFVADGVSNSNGGQAAAIIGKEIRKPMAQLLLDCADFRTMPEEVRTREIHEQLRDVIGQLDAALRAMDNCCATISIALVLGSFVYTANLGDSPIFLIELDNDDATIRLTELYECQNAAGLAVANGDITKEQALTSPLKNGLNQAIGWQSSRKDIYVTKAGLGQNSLLLLGSDGALSVLTEQALLELIDTHLPNGLNAVNSALFKAVQATQNADDNYTLVAQCIRTK